MRYLIREDFDGALRTVARKIDKMDLLPTEQHSASHHF